MAAIWAGRTARDQGKSLRIAAFDGAARLGAKILVAGGGRCNVTHHRITEADYAGSSRPAIRKVLLRFPVERTIDFFRDLNVELKQEETGKLFPVTDRARTVLDALLYAAEGYGVELRHPCRVHALRANGPQSFEVETDSGCWHARRVVLATGGRALPKTGSDGAGYDLAKGLGHSITDYTFPALVPLVVTKPHPLLELTGIATPATLTVCSRSGKHHETFTGSTLLTHFGISGPAVLDISRYLSARRLCGEDVHLRINWLPHLTEAELDAKLRALGKVSPLRFLTEFLPERLARTLCTLSGVEAGAAGHALTREGRMSLLQSLNSFPLDLAGDRGFTFAEATAGGVPLREITLETMESRLVPGFSLCGEVLDVDGRVGGFNFQWAWASGFVAGTAAANSICP